MFGAGNPIVSPVTHSADHPHSNTSGGATNTGGNSNSNNNNNVGAGDDTDETSLYVRREMAVLSVVEALSATYRNINAMFKSGTVAIMPS
jgi:hypothetical protein